MWTYRGDEPTVMQWLETITTGHEGHHLAARSTRRRHRVLGATTVMLAGLSAAAAFSTVVGESRPMLLLGAGIAAAAAATTALLHTVTDDADVIASHQRAAADYGDLRRQLEQAILSERITDDRLAEIRVAWTRIEDAAPSLPARAARAARATTEKLQAATLPAPQAPAAPAQSAPYEFDLDEGPLVPERSTTSPIDPDRLVPEPVASGESTLVTQDEDDVTNGTVKKLTPR